MRITLVTDTCNGQINGVVTTLEKTVSILTNRGHTVTLITPDQFKTVQLPSYPEIKIAYNTWDIGKHILDSDPDSLHIFTEGPLGFSARLWAAFNRLHYTTSYHTRFPEYLDERLGFGSGLAYWFLRWFHNDSDAVLVNSPGMEALLKEKGIRNVARWGRGVDIDLYRPDGMVPALYASLPRPIMLNVGRVAVEKNLEAFYSLDLPGSFVQVGGGPALEELKDHFPHVHFVGPKSGEVLASYYRGADVFVFPSKSDTFGLVMLESIASGVPVAAFDVIGPKDVVINSRTGVLGPLETAIPDALSLRTKPNFDNDIRLWALTQSWESCTDQFERALVSFDRKQASRWKLCRKS